MKIVCKEHQVILIIFSIIAIGPFWLITAGQLISAARPVQAETKDDDSGTSQRETDVPESGESFERPDSKTGIARKEQNLVPETAFIFPAAEGAVEVMVLNPFRTLIDLNKAPTELLCLLDGIGYTTARSIIDYRDKHGLFQAKEELLEVRGIGEKKLKKLKDLTICSSP